MDPSAFSTIPAEHQAMFMHVYEQMMANSNANRDAPPPSQPPAPPATQAPAPPVTQAYAPPATQPSGAAPLPSQPSLLAPPPSQPLLSQQPAFPAFPTFPQLPRVTPFSYQSNRLPAIMPGTALPGLPLNQVPNRALQSEVNMDRLASSAAHPPARRRGARAASSNATSQHNTTGRRTRGAARPAPALAARSVRQLITANSDGTQTIPIRWFVHLSKEVCLNDIGFG